MATIKFSSIVSDVRGSVGGVVFARGANGSYIRSFAKATNKRTSFQDYWKGNLSFYAAKWRQLSEVERESWINAKDQFPYQNRVGEKSTYTGFQLFMSTNLWLESAAFGA